MSKGGLVVKRSGVDEPYDERKLYASVFISLRVANENEKQAEVISSEVVKIVSRWMAGKTHVTAHDIREHASHHLADYSKTAAYLYKHHRVLA